MYISKVHIKNFRNLRKFEVELNSRAVLLGENGAGKTNFFDALRLVLDQDFRGRLSGTDFSYGVTQFRGTTIEVHIWFSGFDLNKDKDLLSCVHDCRVSAEDENLTAKLSAVYRPIPDVRFEEALSEDEYQFIRYARDDEANTEGSRRFCKFVKLILVPALRDIGRDMQSWRLSPMRRMVEQMNLTQDHDFLDVVEQVKTASKRLQQIPVINELQGDIREILGDMVEDVQSIDPTIGLLSSNPDDLQRMLTLFVETSLPLERSSLGLSNILYMVTWLVYLEHIRTMRNNRSQFTILAIEEPEAHLHPHLQRLVFRNVFERDIPVLVATHSPTIVSLAQSDWFALFKHSKNGVVAVSTSKIARLDERLRIDLNRFLDATRGEIVFARGVLLVEGDAEIFLVPEMARKLKEANKIARTLDGTGVSICSVSGTDFRPYVEFLGPSGLDLPFALITDGDLTEGAIDQSEENGVRYAGLRRGLDLVKLIDDTQAEAGETSYQEGDWTDVGEVLRKSGIFVNRLTLEDELLAVGYRNQFLEVYEELGGSKKQQQNMRDEIDSGQIAKVIKRIERSGMGKGRFAQRLASKVDADKVPPYIKDAIRDILQKTSPSSRNQPNGAHATSEPETDPDTPALF